MLKLIQLEMKRNKMKPYYISLLIINIVATSFLYLIATIAKVENDSVFLNYENILKMHTVITFIIFSVFSVVLFSKFVIEDYTKQRALLLFSYPVSRTKIFTAKLILVLSFITIGFFISTLLPNTLFFITEQFVPILSGDVTLGLVGAQLINIIAFVLAIMAIGLISLRIGFSNKSISATIVSAIVLSVILGNLLMGLGKSSYVFIGIILLFVFGLLAAKSTKNLINEMEV